LNAFHFGRDAVCLRVEVLCEFYFLFPINIWNWNETNFRKKIKLEVQNVSK
jgi:hypothetical protein